MGVETKVYSLASVEDMHSIKDNRGCTYFAVFVETFLDCFLVEQLYDERMKSSEAVYISLDREVAKTLSEQGIPRSSASLFFADRGGELPQYLKSKYQHAELV
ncbi:hypothetical protein KY338_03370 [Candidatus Woesearchaeota archaeon]|nr:hypothetical protein [Candidatus Woesearchaeota archaeon]MBW3005357.1 hypothetical protein [Candidatus Woesearchaeota archaeon]